jgi:hypothetical protein
VSFDPAAAPANQRLPDRKTVLWLIAVSLLIAGLTWLTLYEIRDTALHNRPDPDAHAACLAAHTGADAAAIDKACPNHAKVIFAARHPLRNALILLILLLVGGYCYLIFHRSRWGPSFGKRLPPEPRNAIR